MLWRDGVLAGAALAGYEEADFFEELGGSGGAFGEEGVGGEGSLVGGDGAADDEGGEGGIEGLSAADELVSVHAGEEQVGDEEVDGSRCRMGRGALEDFERLLGVVDVEDAVAAGFEEEGSDGEGGFVIVDAEDDFLWAHGSFFLPSGGLNAEAWAAGRGAVWRIATGETFWLDRGSFWGATGGERSRAAGAQVATLPVGGIPPGARGRSLRSGLSGGSGGSQVRDGAEGPASAADAGKAGCARQVRLRGSPASLKSN